MDEDLEVKEQGEAHVITSMRLPRACKKDDSRLVSTHTPQFTPKERGF